MSVVTGNEREHKRIWLRMKQKRKSKSTKTSHWGNNCKSEMEGAQEREQAGVKWSVARTADRLTDNLSKGYSVLQAPWQWRPQYWQVQYIHTCSDSFLCWRWQSLFFASLRTLLWLQHLGRNVDEDKIKTATTEHLENYPIVLHIRCTDGSGKGDEQWIVLTAASFLPSNSIKA